MPTRKQSKSKPLMEEPQAPQPEPAQTEEETLSDEIEQETDALMDVAQKLEKVSQNFANQQQQQQQFLATQRNLRDILSRIATGIEQSSIANARESERIAAAQAQPNVQAPTRSAAPSEQKECGCECVDAGCCCFDIYLDSVRAIQPQLEPADSGDIVGLINELEVQLFMSIGEQGIIVPGDISTTMSLRVGSIALGGKPGPYVSINRVIRRICLPKGTTRDVEVYLRAAERDEGVERPLGLKDEFGEASGWITLNCCMPKIYPAKPIDLSFEHGGTGGGVPGMISATFYAQRVCC
jgi:hypothetical protein